MYMYITLELIICANNNTLNAIGNSASILIEELEMDERRENMYTNESDINSQTDEYLNNNLSQMMQQHIHNHPLLLTPIDSNISLNSLDIRQQINRTSLYDKYHKIQPMIPPLHTQTNTQTQVHVQPPAYSGSNESSHSYVKHYIVFIIIINQQLLLLHVTCIHLLYLCNIS